MRMNGSAAQHEFLGRLLSFLRKRTIAAAITRSLKYSFFPSFVMTVSETMCEHNMFVSGELVSRLLAKKSDK